MDLKNLRINYKKSKINYDNLYDHPIDFFLEWMDDAMTVNKLDANACVLSTVSDDSIPSSRVVLLKMVDLDGFVFFTNYNSNKSVDIDKNNNVALNFYWPLLERQVRVVGKAHKVPVQVSDDYFKNRPRDSQFGACVSKQSSRIDFDFDFDYALRAIQKEFKDKEVNRPLEWGGYRVTPNVIEFWQGRPSRLHDRVVYEFYSGEWRKMRLAP